ncbi:hypothetical protein GQ55_5G094900 [Panicum hallii var. hallii]|uniref:rRNA N-glycosylase n=1 Tax=Panicum hallii var. hallii TaxID=1504633 RepID=A0A2T7DEH5_9POAL|nr:hypothetical protein GQ55_5G094900 [Panicum hallii var. hallii]
MSDRDEKRKLREARKEDADMERAQEQDRAPVRKHLQRRIEDIPVYTILEDADDRAFYKLLMQRRAGIFEVASITILGVPVTPPELPSPAGVTEERLTFHAVKLVGRIRTVLLLLRETDMYFVAFNPSGDPTSTWFTFDDAPIPSFLNQVALPYDGRYGDLTKLEIGYYCVTEIIDVLSKV